MNEEVFELLLKVSENVNHKFVGVGGSNRDQRIADDNELKKYKILSAYGLINNVGDNNYTITEYGKNVSQHKSWEEYLNHIKEISDRKVKKEKLDLKISEFQVRTRNWPFFLSAIGIIMSGIALYKSFYPENDFNENIMQKEVKLTNETIVNQKIIKFLKNPMNLFDYKKKKGMQFTTSVTNGTEYYFLPKIKDSIFYTYYYPTENFTDSKRIDQVVVFKHGKNKHSYDDETETLIELRVFNKDSVLGKANLVGLTKMELESKFGSDYLTFDNGIAYSNKNNILILKLNNSKVYSFKYIKLNTEKIDRDLIGQIIE